MISMHGKNIPLPDYDEPGFMTKASWRHATKSNMFSKEPTSAPSDLLTDTFIASLYSPDGTILESKSLFILDFIKLFLASAI